MIWLGLGIADFVLTSYRTTPLSAIDFALLKSVWSILQVYLDIWQIVLVIVLFLAIVAGLVVLYRHARKMQARRLGGLVFVSSCGVITALSSILLLSTGILSNEFYNLADAYADYGFPYCFARSIFDRGIDEPEDYSVNRVQQFLSDIHAETDSTPSKTPNIVMVQLESFFDVNYLRNLTYSENPVPVFTALKANFPHGFLTVPALGAGTANTEFEVITGMNLDYFGTGEYPYETILKKTACETIGYDLKELGYSTHAIHNNTATFYDRNLVYPNLGFDTFTSLEYMDNIETNALGWPRTPFSSPRSWMRWTPPQSRTLSIPSRYRGMASIRALWSTTITPSHWRELQTRRKLSRSGTMSISSTRWIPLSGICLKPSAPIRSRLSWFSLAIICQISRFPPKILPIRTCSRRNM